MMRERMKSLLLVALAFGALSAFLAVATQTRAGLIDVDFYGPDLNGVPVSGTYSGGAVLGGAGDVWNAFGGVFFDSTARTNLPLVASDGTFIGVTLGFSGQLGFFDAGPNGVLGSTPFAALMDDYMYVHANSGTTPLITTSFNGLTPGDSYRIVLYSSSDVAGRETIFTVNGSTQTVQNPGAVKALVQGLTYADFTTKADGGGQLSFTVGYPLFGEGNLDGIQLEHIDSSVPEPGTFVISSIVIVTFGALRLRTRLKRAN